MKFIRVLSNFNFPHRLEIDDCRIDVQRLDRNDSFWRLCNKLRRADVIIFNHRVRKAALIYKILSSRHISLICVDSILHKPTTLYQLISAVVKSRMFRHVDLFVNYAVLMPGYKEHYDIPFAKMKCVPFKPNSVDKLNSIEIEDRDYIFSGGNTHRDYHTLLKAVESLPMKIIIVSQRELLLPPRDNVTVIRHDGNQDTWLEYIAKSKFVVLPVTKESINPSGISTYLTAMALKKAVIHSVGPAVDGILNNELAILVPPEDAISLRKAIVRLYEDDNYRQRLQDKGYAYACSLGNDDRLYRDILTTSIDYHLFKVPVEHKNNT